MAVSQNGWPAVYVSTDSKLTNYSYITGKIRAGDVHTIFMWLAKEYERTVEDIRRNWSWGWNYREIRGGITLSNHASGTAADYNAPRHPLGVSPTKTMTKAQIKACRELASRTGGVVRWGGDYAGRKDTMHWEINRDAAAVRRLADQIRNEGSVAPVGKPKPTTKPKPADIWKGISPADAKNVQRALRAMGKYKGAIDGVYGSMTKAAVKSYQQDAIKYGGAKFKADGEWGPLTQRYFEWVRDELQPQIVRWAASERLGKMLQDGHYGPLTANHVAAVQAANPQLYPPSKYKVDGQAGDATCKAFGIKPFKW